MFTHLTGVEWAIVVAIAACIYAVGAWLVVVAVRFEREQREWNKGPQAWKGWEGFRADDRATGGETTQNTPPDAQKHPPRMPQDDLGGVR